MAKAYGVLPSVFLEMDIQEFNQILEIYNAGTRAENRHTEEAQRRANRGERR
jgi:hypothetical protein